MGILLTLSLFSEACEFCTEFRTNYSPKVATLFGDASFTRVITIPEAPNVILMSDISPIVEGHGLLCPIEHYQAFSEINSSSIFTSVNSLFRRLSKCFSDHENILFFEHGGTSHDKGAKCIDHAHIHFLPCTNQHIIKLREALATYPGLKVLHQQRGERYEEMLKGCINGSAYVSVFYFKNDGLLFTQFSAVGLPCQFVRYVFSKANGIRPRILGHEAVRKAIYDTTEVIRTLS